MKTNLHLNSASECLRDWFKQRVRVTSQLVYLQCLFRSICRYYHSHKRIPCSDKQPSFFDMSLWAKKHQDNSRMYKNLLVTNTNPVRNLPLIVKSNNTVYAKCQCRAPFFVLLMNSGSEEWVCCRLVAFTATLWC